MRFLLQDDARLNAVVVLDDLGGPIGGSVIDDANLPVPATGLENVINRSSVAGRRRTSLNAGMITDRLIEPSATRL
jgi:hypothetical protein